MNDGLQKQFFSERDSKFDRLLNKKCSWSYKSHKDKIDDNETRLQIMDFEEDVELYNSKNKLESNNRPRCKKSENLSNDTPDKIVMRHNSTQQKNNKVELSSFQMRKYGKSNKTEKIKPQDECMKPRLSNNIPTINLTPKSNFSSASSSDADVFQTRYSILDKRNNETSDNLNDFVPNLIEKKFDSEYISENISNTNTSPIIVETKAYNKMKYPVIAEQALQIKKQRETILLKETEKETGLKDYFTEESNLHTNIKSNSDQFFEDGLNTNFDSGDNISIDESNEKCIKDRRRDASVTPKRYLVHKNTKCPTAVDENNIIEDIFNGTFDVTKYKVVSPKTTEFSEHQNKLKSVMQTNEEKRNSKRKINELAAANKRVKHEISESQEKKSILNPREETKELSKKLSRKTLNENKNLNNHQIPNTLSDKTKPQQKKRKEKFDSFNININFLGLMDGSHENRQKKSKNCQIKYEDNNSAYDTEENDIHNKYSRRKLRSSSLIASKKIKEIEKIENLQDLDDEIIIVDEIDHNVYDDPFKSHKKHNNRKTMNSLRGNSNPFKPKTTSKKRKLEQSKNSEMPMQYENEFSSLLEWEGTAQRSEINKRDARLTDNKLISRPYIHLLKSPHYDKIPMKQNTNIDNKQNQALSLNSFYKYMANVDPNLPKNNHNFDKRSKTDIKLKNSDVTHCSSTFLMGSNSQKEDTNNFTVSKRNTTKSSHKTWEMLEKELLRDLDSEQVPDNVSKTVILKKQETVTKKEVAKDKNLFTVSNTSMLKTISKSKTGNNYNLKYEIKNTKSKFVGPKSDPTHNFMNTTVAQQMTTKDSNFKSKAIVNKTITAMEKCAAKFIAPEVKLGNVSRMVSNWHPENLSDNLDTHQETQFHSHMTFIAHDDKCFSNKIVGYAKKSNKVQVNWDFDQKGDVSKAISHSSRTQRNKRGKALSTKNSNLSNKNNLPLEYLQNPATYDKTEALVPYGGERNNPWEKLMDKLDLREEHQSLNEETNISKSEMKDQNTESLVITKTFTQHSKNLETNETLLIQADYKVNKTKLNEETLNDQHYPAEVESDAEQSKFQMPESKNRLTLENSSQTTIENKKIALENSDIFRKLELQKISIKNELPKKQLSNTVNKNKIKSPSFKFKVNKHGTLKLRKHSTSGSSSSITSGDSSKLKKIKLHEKKRSQCNSSATNKARNKYKIYLKKLFDGQNPAIDDGKTKSEENTLASNKCVLKEPLDKSQKSLNKTKDSLIARQEDDIFSISSSDESSDGSTKNYGTGPMCELFDE